MVINATMPLHSFVAKALPFHLPRSQCVFDIWYFMRLNIYCQRCEYTKSFEYGCMGEKCMCRYAAQGWRGARESVR